MRAFRRAARAANPPRKLRKQNASVEDKPDPTTHHPSNTPPPATKENASVEDKPNNITHHPSNTPPPPLLLNTSACFLSLASTGQHPRVRREMVEAVTADVAQRQAESLRREQHETAALKLAIAESLQGNQEIHATLPQGHKNRTREGLEAAVFESLLCLLEMGFEIDSALDALLPDKTSVHKALELLLEQEEEQENQRRANEEEEIQLHMAAKRRTRRLTNTQAQSLVQQKFEKEQQKRRQQNQQTERLQQNVRTLQQLNEKQLDDLKRWQQRRVKTAGTMYHVHGGTAQKHQQEQPQLQLPATVSTTAPSATSTPITIPTLKSPRTSRLLPTAKRGYLAKYGYVYGTDEYEAAFRQLSNASQLSALALNVASSAVNLPAPENTHGEKQHRGPQQHGSLEAYFKGARGMAVRKASAAANAGLKGRKQSAIERRRGKAAGYYNSGNAMPIDMASPKLDTAHVVSISPHAVSMVKRERRLSATAA